MNDLLELKGELKSGSFDKKIRASLPVDSKVDVDYLKKLKKDFSRMYDFWTKKDKINGSLISIYYNRVIPKSSRIRSLLSKASEESNDYVRGVRFSSDKKHIITYHISCETLKNVISRLEVLIKILNEKFEGVITNSNLNDIDKYIDVLERYEISKSYFKVLIKDTIDIEKIDVYQNQDFPNDNNTYITIFDTGTKISDIMTNLGIKNTEYEIFSNDTIYANNKTVLAKIKKEAPYIISMAMTDLATYYNETENKVDPNVDFSDMPNPTNEPTIGVIDTLFDTNVYFSSWVDYEEKLNKSLPREPKDYIHGTEVTSIIVDGARINKKWDDECGFFQVRHFGVAKEGVNNSYDIINNIKDIVENNKDIKVWNISLGSCLEINENYISPEASVLDEIQYENNVIFVVAGTNSRSNEVVRIGAPADSINSLVINAINKDGKKPNYARRGKVLSFFVKPDVCAFGGDKKEYVNVCTPTGLDMVQGTSFAAPWISRKLSYLIDKMGLSRQIAKALIIDSAIKWGESEDIYYLGYGVVPTKISEIIKSKKEEIKFYIEGNADSYYTYTYELPVPMVNGEFPFYAKAVLCYFPKCSRSQGVDYTDTELDLQFGRTKNSKIDSLNKNTQGEEYEKATNEAKARELFRKWDNVKIVKDEIKSRKVPRMNYGNNLWGIKVTNKARLEREKGLRFGIVVTLKEMYEKNRTREFIDQCIMRKWIVNTINMESRIDVYEQAEEIIEFK